MRLSLPTLARNGMIRAMADSLRWIVWRRSSSSRCCSLRLQNTEPVTLTFFNRFAGGAPLVFVVLVAFACGRRDGLLAGALRGARLKRQLNRLRREPRNAARRAARRRVARPARTPASGRRIRPQRPLSTAGPPRLGQRPMDFELWWLLPIPALFFALGWIAARIDIKHLLRESRALPLSYFRGLNFLLNEQPDKAIESFIEVVKVDPQTIDLHFALGSLFRRQGEIDRAIRMHQNLLDRPDLPADRRETATFELAQDFHRAGLLDRAEELFTKLDGTPYEHAALGFLHLDLRDREGLAEGDRGHAAHGGGRQARRTSRRSRTTTASSRRPRWSSPTSTAARTEIDLALAEYRACARATMLAGDVEAQQGDPAEAIDAWQRIESQNPAFLSLVAERVADAYREARQRRAGHPRARAATRRSIRRSTC